MRVVYREAKAEIVAQTFQIKEWIIQLLGKLRRIFCQETEILFLMEFPCMRHDEVKVSPVFSTKQVFLFLIREVSNPTHTYLI